MILCGISIHNVFELARLIFSVCFGTNKFLMLSLRVSENQVFNLSLEAASLCPPLQKAPAGAEILFSGASEACVRRLVEYLEFYKTGDIAPSQFQRPLVSSDLAESGGTLFDCAFAESLTHDEVQELLKVAERLEVTSLVELMAACVARTLRMWKASGTLRMEAGFQ